MKSVLFTLFVAATLAACGKKEEAPAVAPTPAVAPAAPSAPAPVASESAKTEEAKK